MLCVPRLWHVWQVGGGYPSAEIVANTMYEAVKEFAGKPVSHMYGTTGKSNPSTYGSGDGSTYRIYEVVE